MQFSSQVTERITSRSPSDGSSGAGSAFPARGPADEWPLRSYLELGALASAVPHARRHTRHTLAAWALDQTAADAELVVSELMTNAVQATQEAAAMVAVYLALARHRLFVLVWDSCPEPPVHHGSADADAETGRGLTIVEALSHRWGTCSDDCGKVVWAQLTVTGP